MKTLNKIIEELVEENEQLNKHIDDLISDNYELQNTLIEHQINLYDKTKYIDTLKNELFNAYLLHEHQERLILELKTALSSYNNFVDVMFPD